MTRKHNSESSDDDFKDGRDRYRHHSSKKVVELNNHRSRRDESDSSDSDRRNRNSRHEREDDRISHGKDRSRTNKKDLGVRDERKENEHHKLKETRRSSDEDDKQVDSDRGRRDRDRTDQHEDRHRQQEAVEAFRVKESYQGSDKDDKQMGRERGRQERERTHQHEHGRRRRESEDEYGVKKSEHNFNEDDKRVEGERSRRERERESAHQPENGSRRNELKGRDKNKNSDQSSDEDDRRMEKKRVRRERERARRHENGDKQRDTEGYRVKDQHSHRDSEAGDDKDGNTKFERQWDENHWRHGHDYRREKKNNENRENEEHGRMNEDQSTMQVRNLNSDAPNLGRSGGVYIPPFKLARMMKEVQDKSSVEYQRLTWDALRKSINGLVNKVNATNIKNIIPELFAENLIRGRGLFCRSCMKSQMASPGFTDVFAALVAVVNTKFPEVGDLLLRRIVLQLKRAYKRNDKPQLLAVVKFIAHLVNQQVAHEIIALELLTLLLEKPTDDSVEVAVGFVTECGSILQDLSPKGLHGIFERFRGILHEGEIDKRVQFLIEGLFAIRKAKFQGHPAVRPELDLVEQEDQLTLELSLTEEIDPEIALDIFKPDPQFLENEKRYEEVKKTIIGEDSEDEEGPDGGSEDEDDDEDDEDEDDDDDEEQMQIKDETETNLVNLRRTIYLTIMSSVDFEEAGHKLLKIKLEPGQEMELCIMLLECCSQERTYLRYYGLLGQRFCMINRIHQENFEKCFVQQYSMIHRLETNKLRNVAKFFAHLLGTDALPWHVLEYIRLTEEDTTSSSRIFIKILFQELSEQLGIRLLNERLSDPTMQSSFDSIFPKDNPKNTRFAINFFTSIGLGGITENLREYLKNMPRLIMQQQKPVSESDDESESSGASGSDKGGSDSESESSSSSSSDESDRDRRHKKRRKRG